MKVITADELATKLVDDPATSDWLRKAVWALLERDPIDAANDSATLAEIFQKRANEILDQ